MRAERDWRLFDMILSEKACFAVKKSAAEMLQLFKNNELAEGEVYRVTDRLVLSPDTVFCGNNAVIIAEDGIETGGDNVSLYKCKLISDNGIISSFDGFTLRECEIESDSVAVLSSGKYFVARNNTITSRGIGIRMTGGSYNSMAAQNTINSEIGVYVDGGYNCVVILNDTQNIICENNTHIYVIKNNSSGNIELKNNKYLICDENAVNGDIISQNNTEFNGDNVQDITQRRDYGANEELLPHVNNEQFVGMERKRTVTDPSFDSPLNLSDYLCQSASITDVVIIPPGVYSVDAEIVLDASHGNTEIYAYGVYAEATFFGQITHFNSTTDIDFRGLTWGYSRAVSGQIHIVEKYGEGKVTAIVTAGYRDGFGKSDLSFYGTNHVDLFHKNEKYPYAGIAAYYDIADNSDGTYALTFKDPWNVYARVEVGDVMVCRLAGPNRQTVTVRNAKNMHFKDVTIHGYGQGTHFRNRSCEGVSYERYAATPNAPVIIDKATYDKYKSLEEKYGVDLEVYRDENGRYRGGLPRIGGTGTMEVQDSYGGVDLTSCRLNAMYDDGSNQRGTSARFAGIEENGDGTYTVYYKGSLSSVYYRGVDSPNMGTNTFEPGMCADVRNGDLLFAYNSNGVVLFDGAVALEDAHILADSDKHFAHCDENLDGICDACGKKIFKSESSNSPIYSKYDGKTGKIIFDIPRFEREGVMTYTTPLYAVKVKIDGEVNESALDGYDLLLNDYDTSTQFFFDNVSRGCYGFTFDNVLFENGRSRGLLIKTRDVTVKNCTFRDLGLQGIIIGRETNWGESSVPKNVLIENCIFDNTSNSEDHENMLEYPQILIQGLGEMKKDITLSEHFACENITIKHNKFLNTKNANIIYASAVKGLNVTENIFEERKDDLGKVMHINGCLDVEILNNKYSEKMQKNLYDKTITSVFDIYNYRNIKIECFSGFPE